MASSIFSRKLDLVYLIFFAIHIAVIFNVDLVAIYPDWLKQQYMIDLRKWYISTYSDQFFVSPPAWFSLYTYLELLYHAPLSVWAIGALLRNDPRLPIHLLIYAVQTALTTATCIADYMSWTSVTNAQKLELGKLYVPYLAVSIFMGVDMYARLARAVVGGGGRNTNSTGEGKKRV